MNNEQLTWKLSQPCKDLIEISWVYVTVPFKGTVYFTMI